MYQQERSLTHFCTWYAEEGRWKQVLPPMPTRWVRPKLHAYFHVLVG